MANRSGFLSICFLTPILAGVCFAQANSLSVTEFGAPSDGASDATPAFAKALDAAAQKAVPRVVAPPGRYRIEGNLEIPHSVALEGSWTVPHHSESRATTAGTVLLVTGGRGTEDGPPLFLMNANSSIRGFTICYPDQRPDEIVPYPWTIQGRGMHCTIENVTLVNAYQAIDFGTHHNELHIVRNVFGLALRRGVWVDNCTDIGRIENVHFNPHYWARSPWGRFEGRSGWRSLMEYLVDNGEAFIFGRSDWEYVLNTFCYGYRVGYKFIPGRSKIGTNGNFVGIGADGGNIALLAEAANPYGILVTNGEFVAMRGPEPTEIVTGPDFKGVLQLNNCSFWGPAYRAAKLDGPGTVTFSQCNFVQWNREAHAIRAENGVLAVTTSRFQLPSPHIFLGPGVDGATITGNLITGPLVLDNQAEGKVAISSNVDELPRPR